jgi:GT2 family glycosyltransferase
MVSFVVLNWHHEDATEVCVSSIRSLDGAAEIEIVVVDNESRPESRERLDTFDAVVVALESNRGFTGGMNAGVAATHGSLVALINNDTVLPRDWLSTARRCLDDPKVGIVGGRDDETTVPLVDPRGSIYLSRAQVSRREVSSVDGAHMLIRRTAWDQVGGFDDDFFAYHEDADLCARVIAHGWKVIYEPDLWATHRRGSSSDRVPVRRVFWARRNRFTWIAKNFPDERWRRALLAAYLECLSRAYRGQSRADRLGSLHGAAWLMTHIPFILRKRRSSAQGADRTRYFEVVVRAYALKEPDG